MATFIAIKNRKQTAGAMQGVLKYVAQDHKTKWGELKFVTGHNCVPQCAFTEMMTTKKRFRKTDGRQFYHFVQSFPEEDDLTPQEGNAIGLEFAAREFPDFEVVVATHLDTGHLHNHLVVNSVNCADGKKLHQNAADLQAHRNVNDEICLKHGLSVLEKAKRHEKKKRMKPGEYQAGLRGESWKLDLIHVINEALEYADDRESFIYNVEQEGYQVVWSDTRKHITFITPEGWHCRDSSLHDETFLKENLEMLFRFRQIFGFTPGTEEPDEGWMGEMAYNAAEFGRYLEQALDTPELPPIPTWSESKQRSREALKKLAHINLEGRYLEVRQNVKEVCRREGTDYVPGREVKVGKTKTATSKRRVPLNKAAVTAVEELRQERYFGPNTPIVSDEKGDYTRPVNFRKRYYRILKAAGIELKGLHSLRHTFGSSLVNGIRQPDGTLMALSPRQVADLLGHSTSQITEMYYVKKDTTRLQGITDGFNF